MNNNYVFTNINDALPTLMGDVMKIGGIQPSRNGATRELTHVGITLEDPLQRELLLPSRKHNIVAQIAETMWVLAGRADVEWLGHYLPRARDYSDDGKVWGAGYGPRLRDWHNGFDQLAYVVKLLNEDQETRQAVISLWDPTYDTADGPLKDRACNNWLHFLARDGQLDLSVSIRSNDALWGWSGINAFEWSVLLEVVADMTDLAVGSLHFSVSSFHVYEQHWERALEIANDEVGSIGVSPRFTWLSYPEIDEFDNLLAQWFDIEADIRAGSHSVEQLLESIAAYPEPMFRSWLSVLAFWWRTDNRFLVGLENSNLVKSLHLGIQPKQPVAPKATLINRVVALHNEKNAAYGGSWCKRGEILGIMANIARKVDRLGGAATSDESAMDTAMDLFVYCSKYLAWIEAGEQDDYMEANDVMRRYCLVQVAGPQEYLEEGLRRTFADLEAVVLNGPADHQPDKHNLVEHMIHLSWALVSLWDSV